MKIIITRTQVLEIEPEVEDWQPTATAEDILNDYLQSANDDDLCFDKARTSITGEITRDGETIAVGFN
jgi:hypothetical protein